MCSAYQNLWRRKNKLLLLTQIFQVSAVSVIRVEGGEIFQFYEHLRREKEIRFSLLTQIFQDYRLSCV